MPRKALEQSPFYPYHVCNRSIDKVFYPVDLEILWKYSCDLLRILSWTFDVRIHAFVLMSNHYHLLLSTPSINLHNSVRYFQTEFSRWLKDTTEKGIYAFDGRYKYSIIKDPVHYMNVYRYVYQNPVRAGIVSNVEAYRWSAIRGKSGLDLHNCPIAEHEFNGVLPSIEESELAWLNTTISDTELNKIRRGLRKSIFSPPNRLVYSAGKEGVHAGK
jgi:putative transposase